MGSVLQYDTTPLKSVRVYQMLGYGGEATEVTEPNIRQTCKCVCVCATILGCLHYSYCTRNFITRGLDLEDLGGLMNFMRLKKCMEPYFILLFFMCLTFFWIQNFCGTYRYIMGNRA